MFITWREYKGKRANSLRCHLRHSYLESGFKKETAKYLGCVALKPSKPEREVFWMQVKSALDKLSLTTEQRLKIEAVIAQKVPRGKHEKFISAKSDEHDTPKYFLKAAVECMGGLT